MPVRALLAAWALLLFFAVSPGGPAQAQEISPHQRQAIEGIIHDYLLHHPQVLIDALRAAEQKLDSDAKEKAASTIADRRREIFNDPATPVGGNKHGDISLVEFFDYQCPYCKRVQPALDGLAKRDKGLRLVYKEFPILGPASVVAARAALAARLQGKYEAFHAAMMARTGHITDATVYEVAQSVGIDVERLKHDMAGPQIEADLKANRALARKLDITGTPAFVIGHRIIPGAVSLEDLQQSVADARKR
ncbi:MAG TPA: DsbA family protein [Stellaceae bacterium]|nr:DsbA family protein [Stellaceae bacterium]